METDRSSTPPSARDREPTPGGDQCSARTANAAMAAISSWTNAAVMALQSCGRPGAEIAKECGISTEALASSREWVPIDALDRLLMRAVAETGDAAFGLRIPDVTTPALFWGFGPGLAASATVEEAFERVIRHDALFGGAVNLRLVKGPTVATVSFRLLETAPEPALDLAAAAILRLCRVLIGDLAFCPQRARLVRPEPDDLGPFRERFGPNVEFSQPSNQIELPRSLVERPLPAACREVARAADQMLDQFLNDRSLPVTSNAARDVIARLLADRPATRQEVARALGISTRNMHRRLAEEGTSFREILDDVRMKLAYDLLAQGRLSKNEIAYRLRFSSGSTFARAFRRATGRSPSDYDGQKTRR